VQSRTKKVAAALAAVEAFLAAERGAQSSIAFARSVSGAAGGRALSPWALAGRLALMNSRMSSASHRTGNK
jgi:hypothetical protein